MDRGAFMTGSESPVSPGALRVDRAREEDEALRRVVQRFFLIGVVVWPSFTLLDVFMAFVRHPGAPFALFVFYRAVQEALFVVCYVVSRRPDASIPFLRVAYTISYTSTCAFIALMAVDLGGLESAYVHGASIIILVQVATDPKRFTISIRRSLTVALVFPAVMAIAALWSPEIRAQWRSATTLAAFVSHYVFLLATAVVGSAASHAFWAAQEQVFRARRLGRFRLEAPIGKGGMGEVWLAWDTLLRRSVALKILRSGGEVGDARLRRFEREAQAASLLRSPHTIRIFDFGASDDGIHFIAMEYLPGADLAAVVARFGPLPPARAVRILVQACEALTEAHEAGIIHRDIKPQNIFVTQVGDDHDFVKVLDFGVARMSDPIGESLTHGAGVPGTPLYMAPELWRGAAADARSDIFALGATLQFLLTGTVAATTEATTVTDSGAKAGETTTPARVQGALPTNLTEVVRRCLATDPAARYGSVRDLQADLERCGDLGAWTLTDSAAAWQALEPAGGWRARGES